MGDVIAFPKAKVSPPRNLVDPMHEQFAAACSSAAAQALCDLAADPSSLSRANETVAKCFGD